MAAAAGKPQMGDRRPHEILWLRLSGFAPLSAEERSIIRSRLLALGANVVKE